MRTDSEIQKAVHDELLFEPSVTATDIGITVKNGIVSLVGTVGSYAEKYAAEEAAERVSGLRALAKDLMVKLPGDWKRSDDQIAAAAVQALAWDVQVPNDRITIEVENGVVTLKGDVDWNYQKSAAVNDVMHLTGVVEVMNLIKVVPKVSARQVRSKIESALQRGACRDARGITIEADGGKVTLRGKVQSWSERTDATRAAWNTPGVYEVQDNMWME